MPTPDLSFQLKMIMDANYSYNMKPINAYVHASYQIKLKFKHTSLGAKKMTTIFWYKFRQKNK